MKNVRVGVIGAGWVARNRHLPALKALPEVELRLIWSRDSARAEQAAAESGITSVAGSWEEVACSPQVDAVVIATPPVLHRPATLAALAAGKHVLCQARMARDLLEAEEMLAAARASGLVTALYPPRPGLKGDRVMQRLLQHEHFVGEIREVRLAALAASAPGEGYKWASDPEVVGVNAMTLGMWAEVLNRWVGPARRLSATARIHHSQRKAIDGAWTAATVPDSIAVTAELACGATASYHFSDCASGGPGHLVEIFGSRGALSYRFFAEEIRGQREGSSNWEPILVPAEEERQQTTDAEFVQAILAGGTVTPDFAEGVAYMRFCEAAAFSAHSGRSVDVMNLHPQMAAWGVPLPDTQAQPAS